MSAGKNYHIDARSIQAWAAQCAREAGAAAPIANAIAANLVAADLLGFTTHGLVRLRYNLSCLQDGRSKRAGEPTRVSGRAALELWDADLLSGLYCLPIMVQRAVALAQQYGTGTIILRRTQHVAALAVYLEAAVAAGMLIQIVAATPAQRAVAAHGAKSAWFSPNPFAIGAPTLGEPVLLDMSLSMLAAGKVRAAIANQQSLPVAALITANGDYTCDPRSFLADPPAVLAPLGGAELGYKGSGLNLYSELWTLALSHYGRHQADGDGDANTVWIQVIDPTALGSLQAFQQQAQALVDGIASSTPIDPSRPVRVPGQGALAKRSAQLRAGISYSAAIHKQLLWCAETFAVPLPAPQDGQS